MYMIKLFWVWKDEENERDEPDEEIHEWEEYISDDSQDIGQLALDVVENHESIYILAPIAGVELSNIDISIHESTLSLSWVRNKPKEFYGHSIEVKNQECFWGRFMRNIILPDNMDFSQVQAVMENNLLVIHIPKIRFDSKTIKINKIES